MLILFRYMALREWRLRPLRTVLVLLGVACGIGLFTAVQVINGATSRFFLDSLRSVTGNADLIVETDEAGFPEEVAEKVEKVAGVKHAVPVVETRAWLPETGESVVVMGVDLLQEKAVRKYDAKDKKIIGDALSFITQPDSIIITERFATAQKLERNDKFNLTTVKGKARFTVRGMLKPTGLALAFDGGLAIMDIDAARLNFGKEGRTDRLDVVLEEGVPVDETAQRIRELVGPAFLVDRPEAKSAQMDRMSRSFLNLLTFFSTLALIVGIFLISNSVSISVEERRWQIGMLRATGAPRKTIFGAFAIESVVLGAAGALLGAWGGRWMAATMVDSVSMQLTSNLLQQVELGSMKMTATDWLVALAAGVFTGLVASVAPALDAARVHPLEAMRGGDELEPEKHLGVSREALGWALLGVTGLFVLIMLKWPLRPFQILMQISAILGAALAGPALATRAIGWMSPAASRLADKGLPEVRLAQDGLTRDPRSLAASLLSTVVGLLLVVIILGVNDSFRITLVDWYSRVLHSDLIVSANGRLASIYSQPFDPKLGDEMRALSGVAHVFGVKHFRTKYGGQQIVVKGHEEPPRAKDGTYPAFDIVDGGAAEAGASLFRDEPGALVSVNFSKNFGVKRGDFIELPTARGPRRLRVSGLIWEYASPVGVVYVSMKVLQEAYGEKTLSAFGIRVTEGTDPAKVRSEIDRKLGRKYQLTVALNSEVRAQIASIIDESFAYASTLGAASLLVALIGLANGMVVAFLRRRREIGALRAIGMSRAQVTRMFVWEGAEQGFFGGVVAVLLGSGLTAIWVTWNLEQVMGWKVTFHFPWIGVAKVVGAGVFVAILSAILPARMARNLPIAQSVSHE